jgi:hypothetical protein
MRRILSLLVASSTIYMTLSLLSEAKACSIRPCEEPQPEVGTGTSVLTASYFEIREGQGFASNNTPSTQPYQWRLRSQCQISDPDIGGCNPGEIGCPQPPGRVLSYYIVQSQRLALPDRSEVDGMFPPAGLPIGSGFGLWETAFAGCVDVTDLNPPPSPAEVYRYFRTLPLPELTVRQQPPGNGLVGLPVIFYTDSATTQTFTVDIRGFEVVIEAGTVSYTWHTGDGTDLISDDPGAPYPHQTVTHDYASGTYTAYLTTTWGATYTVNGGAAADVPGTTTTDGPPVTFAVLQARPVLTNPFD